MPLLRMNYLLCSDSHFDITLTLLATSFCPSALIGYNPWPYWLPHIFQKILLDTHMPHYPLLAQ